MRSAITALTVILFMGASMPDTSEPVKQNARTDLVVSVDLDNTVDPRTTITGGTPTERTAVFEALNRFSVLPGELPPLEIKINEGDGCRGHSGLFRTGTERWQIDICEVTPWVILHELGHAWTALHLTDQQRLEYARRWGQESWHDPGTPWRLRGAERAADTIAWGLLEELVGCHLRDGPIASRMQDFRQLTAVDSPRVRCTTRRPEPSGMALVDYEPPDKSSDLEVVLEDTAVSNEDTA